MTKIVVQPHFVVALSPDQAVVELECARVRDPRIEVVPAVEVIERA